MSSGVEALNLHPDPRCLKKRGTWKGNAEANGEKWRYESYSDPASGSVFAFDGLPNTAMAGHVLYVRVSSGRQTVCDEVSIEHATTLTRAYGWVAAQVADGENGNHGVWLRYGPFVLEEVGVYSLEDWERIYDTFQKGAIRFPWVAGPRDATAAGERGPWEL